MIKKKISNFVVMIAMLAILITVRVISVPSGPSITYAGISNSSSASPTLENNASIEGGDIATLVLYTTEQNENWKAYVGNVSGNLVLQDANSYSIYEWPIATPTGEVYATRSSATVNWASVVCANSTHVGDEETEMYHTVTNTPTDAINLTFNDTDHWGFTAGTKAIGSNTCNYSVNPWVNDTAQGADLFEEVLLYDGSNILYTAKIENNLIGYRNDTTTQYDFQMLVAENASASALRTDYYFYVELQ